MSCWARGDCTANSWVWGFHSSIRAPIPRLTRSCGPGPFGCWTRCERSAYRLGPEFPRRGRPQPISEKWAILGHALSERCPTVARNVISVCHGILWMVGESASGRGPTRAGSGERLSRGQSRADVLPGSMASTRFAGVSASSMCVPGDSEIPRCSIVVRFRLIRTAPRARWTRARQRSMRLQTTPLRSPARPPPLG